jgi:hypothetical protein
MSPKGKQSTQKATHAGNSPGLPKVNNPYKKESSSPPRKTKSSPTTKKIKRIGGEPTLTVTRFMDPLTLELFIYSRTPGNDGYLNGLQVALAGSTADGTVVPPSPVLVNGNFHSVPWRRMPNTANQHAVSSNQFWRCVILRYPLEGESTPETRQQGLELLSTFLRDPAHTRFPPAHITLIDETNDDNAPSLDHFLFDDTIEEVMKEDIDENLLNGNFYSNYNQFALKCWAYPFNSPWARSLGFPSPQLPELNQP